MGNKEKDDKLEYDYQLMRDNLVKAAEGWTEGATADYLDLLAEIVGVATLAAEDNVHCHSGLWRNADLCRTWLKYGKEYLQYADRYALDHLYVTGERILETLEEHPRLMAEMLRLMIEVTENIEAQAEHDVDLGVEFRRQLYSLEKNIRLADEGRLDLITTGGVLGSDPVEWTAEFERVVDEADRRVEERLDGVPRQMGFCHTLWSARTEALAELGVEWRSPREMNPGVFFD